MRLVLGVHNHQPVGNFDHVLAEVYQQSYLPFLERLEAHPDIRLCLHNSGSLWEWLEANRPEYLDRLAALVEAGRLEILGGAFYEPILPAIPATDRIGQIRLMNQRVKDRFGASPRGMWLAERVWEPQLASAVASAGIEFVFLDDYHFIQAGLDPQELTVGPLGTEELGARLALMPISEKLRYLIPFREPEETVALCRELHRQDSGAMLVMVDDGEKFGAWPDTYDWVYEKGWLDRFFSALAREKEWLQLSTPSEVLDARPPRYPVYLPPGSYFEMTEWALPVPAAERFTELVADAKKQGNWLALRPFLRGGFWRQFLQRYQESAIMYHRALLLHEDIATAGTGLDDCDIDCATNGLWKAQCNCAYWHGVFGGLYLPHLRHAVFANLIQGSVALGPAIPAGGVGAVAVTGGPFWDLRMRNQELDLFLSPASGGACVLLEDRTRSLNLQNTLRRRREAYHRRVEQPAEAAPEQGGSGHDSIHDRPLQVQQELKDALAVDPQPRFSLLDRLLHRDVVFADVLEDMGAADGGDFADAAYELVSPERPLARGSISVRGWHQTGPSSVSFQKLGRYRGRDGGSHPVHLAKTIALDGERAEIRCSWRIGSRSPEPISFRFASEWNLGLLKGETLLRAQEGPANRLPSEPIAPGTDLTLLVPIFDLRLNWRFDRPCPVWVHEIATVSQAETGFELNYQGHMLLPFWEVDLEPGQEMDLGLTFRLDRP